MALLDRTTASLPSGWYYHPAQYARELEAVWYRDWVCVGRSEDLRATGDYLVAGLGDEKTISPSGFPTGGNGEIILNGELRVGALRQRAEVVGFLDAGNVFLSGVQALARLAVHRLDRSVGPGRLLPCGSRATLQVNEGDQVVFASYSGHDIEVDGNELLIMSEADVLAVV